MTFQREVKKRKVKISREIKLTELFKKVFNLLKKLILLVFNSGEDKEYSLQKSTWNRC